MSAFVEVARLEEIPSGEVIEVEVGTRSLALANVQGRIYAIENECSHMVTPLSEGWLDEATATLECPLHGSVFDLETGAPNEPPATEPVSTYPVKVEDGIVMVAVPDGA